MDHKVKNTIKEIDEIKEDFKRQYPKLTEFELLELSIQHQRNRILIAAFVISPTDKYPGALEAIAIQLGFETKL